MKIAIIGAGDVGSALAAGWVDAGHEVTLGVRSPDAARTLEAAGRTGARLDRIPKAAAQAGVVVLAVPWEAAQDAIDSCGDLSGKIVIDCMNALRPDLSASSIGPDDSAGERVATWATDARVVKAFCTLGSEVMKRPRFGERRAVLFYCGDDADAKNVVRDLIEAIGFEPLDAGPLSASRDLEAHALLWIHLAQRGLGRDFAFGLLRR